MLMVASPVVERMLSLTGRHDLVTIFDIELDLDPRMPAEQPRASRPSAGAGALRSVLPRPGSRSAGAPPRTQSRQDNPETAAPSRSVRTPAWSRSTPERGHATKPSPTG